MFFTFFKPELFLSLIAFSFLFILILKPIFFKYSRTLYLFSFYSIVICLILLLDIIVTNFSDPFVIFKNSYFICTKGILEFKVVFLSFNGLFLYNLSTKIIKRHNLEIFYFNILMYLTAGLILLSTNNFLILILGIELQNFITYILIATYKTKQTSLKSVFLYYLLNSILSGLLLLSVLIFYLFCSTFNFNELQTLLPIMLKTKIFKPWILFSFFLIFSILLFKVAAAPFHFWIKDVYAGIPVALIGFFNINTKLLYFYLIIKLITFFNFPLIVLHMKVLLLIVGTLSFIIGSLLTIYQRSVKTFLVCSSISHTGYILIALSQYPNITVLSAIIGYIFHYLFILLILWGILSYFSEYTMQNDIFLSELPIYFKYNPGICFIFIFCLLSLAGIPPFIGFFFKYQLIVSFCFSSKINLSFLIIFLLFSIISTYYYLIALKLSFFEKNLKNTFIQIYNLLKIENQFLILIICFFLFICSPIFYNILNTIITALTYNTFF